jgi:Protein of unknown function (DUF3738)
MDSKTMLRSALVLGFGAAACVTLDAQAPAGQPPAFEVASIKENVSVSDNASVRAHPVIDKTGLTGVYDLDLTWTPEQAPPGPDGTASPPQSSGDSVSLYTAVQEQLGLKLDAQRGPVDVLVIESAERPVAD